MFLSEVNALRPLPSMIVSVLFLGSTRRYNTTSIGTRQPASFSGGGIPAGVRVVPEKLSLSTLFTDVRHTVSPVGKYLAGVGCVAADRTDSAFLCDTKLC